MTDQQRDTLLTTLRNLGKSIEHTGDERDTATTACLYGLCLAISIGAEVELAHRIASVELSGEVDAADAATEAGDARWH